MSTRTRTGVWLVAGTPTAEPYPCMCRGQRGCTRHCPCRGRTDHLDQMPTVCCGRRAAETNARHEGPAAVLALVGR